MSSSLAGKLDGWTSSKGRLSALAIDRVRTFTWHAAAFATQESLYARCRRQGVPPGKAFPSGWVDLKTPHWSLDGGVDLRAPYSSRLERIEDALPGTLATYQHLFWRAIDPRSDLATCERLLATLEPAVADAAKSIVAGQIKQVAPFLSDLTLSAALILQIRLAMAERNAKTAFEAGCGLIRSLCYLSVSTKFELAANELWQVTVQGVLAGLHDGEFVIQKNDRAFWLMSQWLCERRNDLRRIARGTLYSEWPEPEWATIVDVLHGYVIAFSTPGADASAQLIDALQGSRSRRSDVGEYEYVEAMPLFRALGIAQKKRPRHA